MLCWIIKAWNDTSVDECVLIIYTGLANRSIYIGRAVPSLSFQKWFVRNKHFDLYEECLQGFFWIWVALFTLLKQTGLFIYFGGGIIIMFDAVFCAPDCFQRASWRSYYLVVTRRGKGGSGGKSFLWRLHGVQDLDCSRGHSCGVGKGDVLQTILFDDISSTRCKLYQRLQH